MLQFTGNTKGELSFLAFDTKGAVSAPSSYRAEACKFTVTLTLLPNALSSVSSDQLFPQADAADALPGSFLKVWTLLPLAGNAPLRALSASLLAVVTGEAPVARQQSHIPSIGGITVLWCDRNSMPAKIGTEWVGVLQMAAMAVLGGGLMLTMLL